MRLTWRAQLGGPLQLCCHAFNVCCARAAHRSGPLPYKAHPILLPSAVTSTRQPLTLLTACCLQAQVLAAVDATGALLKSVAPVVDEAAGTAFGASYPGLLAGVPDALEFMGPLGPKPYEIAGERATPERRGGVTLTAAIHFAPLPLSERRGVPKFTSPQAWREVRAGGWGVGEVGRRPVGAWVG